MQLVLIRSWRLTKLAKRKSFSRMNGLIVPKNSRMRHFHRTTSFSADYVIATRWIKPTLIIKVSWTLDAAVKKRWKRLRVSSVPPTREENYAYLQHVWKNHDMQSFKVFLRWYNNKDVVPTLEAIKKMIKFYHSKRIDMLNLGCTLPNLAKVCLHSSTNVKFYPFLEGDEDLLEKNKRRHGWRSFHCFN